jgi:hypothetical protein
MAATQFSATSLHLEVDLQAVGQSHMALVELRH